MHVGFSAMYVFVGFMRRRTDDSLKAWKENFGHKRF